jgi:methylmalonyl-CoA/ethylmalonyl-CoA epimerase
MSEQNSPSQDSATQNSGKIKLGPMIQVGIVVHDVHAAVEAWTSRFEFDEPFFLDYPTEGTPLEPSATYRGRPANFRFRVAFLQAGPMQIEFLQPLEGDNIYADFLEEHGEGLHHLLFEVADPEGIAVDLGVDIIQSGISRLRPNATWNYLDTQEMLGAIIELRTKR